MALHDIISSFNSGELSPYVESRTNLDKYRSGCKRLENYLITPYGPINRRSGTQFLGAAKTSATRARLIGLNLSDSNKIVMELGVGYVRFWQNGELQTYASAQTWNSATYVAGQPVEAIGITDASTETAPVFTDPSASLHPYQEADLRGVNVVQVNDVVYLLHPNYPPMRLSYWGSNPNNPPWTLGQVAWKWAPMLDQNFTSTTVTPSSTPATLSGVKLSYSGTTITATHPNHGLCAGMAITVSGATTEYNGSWTVQSVPDQNTFVFFVTTAPTLSVLSALVGYNIPAQTGSAITLTASAPIWSQNHVGAFWEVSHPNPNGITNLYLATALSGVQLTYSGTTVTGTSANHGLAVGMTINVMTVVSASANYYAGQWTVTSVTANTFTFTVNTAPTATATATILYSGNGTFSSGNIQVQGDWALQTFGVWYGTLYLDQSTDGGATWSVLRTYFSNGDYNATSSGTAEGVSGGYQTLPYFRLRFVEGTGTPSNAPRALFQPINPTLSGYVKITGFVSPTQVEAIVLAPIIGTVATSLWREGAFSAVQGYPGTGVVHQSRVIFAGTNLAPTKVWGSYVGDFENFKQGADASDSISFALATQSGGRIQWMLDKTALLLGTTQDEWYITGDSAGDPITPGSVLAQKQSHYGSAPLPAFVINDTALYVQRMGRKIREFIYTWQSQTWVSNDLTALAQHVTEAGIVEMAYQRVPDAVLWILRTDGTLVTMTYEREQQVSGFSRMLTNPANGDVFESVTTINSDSGEDEIWVIVRRTINGQVSRYIERFCPGQRDVLDQKETGAYWYLDCAKSYAFDVPANVIAGLDHLNGQAVTVWGDSALMPLSAGALTVVNGSITLQSSVSNALVGLPFTSLVVPEQFQRDLQDGTSAGRRMRIATLNVKIYNSQGGEYSSDGVRWYALPTRRVGDPTDAALTPFFGYERVSLAGPWRDGADFYLRQTLPMPLTVSAVVGTWETSEVEP